MKKKLNLMGKLFTFSNFGKYALVAILVFGNFQAKGLGSKEGIVTSIKTTPQTSKGTSLLIRTKTPFSFEILPEPSLNLIMIKVPQENWHNISLPKSNSLITGFFIEHHNDGDTYLGLHVANDVSYAGQSVSSGNTGYEYRFRVKKTPPRGKTRQPKGHNIKSLASPPPKKTSPPMAILGTLKSHPYKREGLFHKPKKQPSHQQPHKASPKKTLRKNTSAVEFQKRELETAIQKKKTQEVEKDKYRRIAFALSGSELATGLYATTSFGKSFGANEAYIEAKPNGSRNITYERITALENYGANIGLGYGINFDRFYLGLEYNYHYLNAGSSYASSPGMLDTHEINAASIRNTMISSHSTTVRIGYFVHPETLLHLRVGHALGKINNINNHLLREHYSERIGYNNTITRRLNGLVVGGGIETALTTDLALRFDLTHMRFKQFKLSAIPWWDLTHQGTFSGSMKPSIYHASLGFSYRFSSLPSNILPTRTSISPWGIKIMLNGTISRYEAKRNYVSPGNSANSGVVRSQIITTSKDLKNFGYGGGIGLFIATGPIYIGAEALFSKRSIEAGQSFKSPTLNAFKDTIGNAFQFSASLGRYLNPSTLVYIRFGKSYSKLSHTIPGNAIHVDYSRLISFPSAFSSKLSGYVAALGVETRILDQLNLHVEYSHEFYGRVNRNSTFHAPTSFARSLLPRSISLKPRVDTITLGLGYTF